MKKHMTKKRSPKRRNNSHNLKVKEKYLKKLLPNMARDKNMNKYYVEIYDRETDQEVFTLEVIDGEFDAAQKQKHDEILLADTEFKYGRRILQTFGGY